MLAEFSPALAWEGNTDAGAECAARATIGAERFFTSDCKGPVGLAFAYGLGLRRSVMAAGGSVSAPAANSWAPILMALPWTRGLPSMSEAPERGCPWASLPRSIPASMAGEPARRWRSAYGLTKSGLTNRARASGKDPGDVLLAPK